MRDRGSDNKQKSDVKIIMSQTKLETREHLRYVSHKITSHRKTQKGVHILA